MASTAADAAQNGIPHTIKDMPGYIENAFHGKEAQMVQVADYLSAKGFIPAALAQNEVSWFYGEAYTDEQTGKNPPSLFRSLEWRLTYFGNY
jgi:hypothetical protein